MKRKASDDICFGEVNIMKYWKKTLLSAQPCRNELVGTCLQVFLRTDHQDHQDNQEHHRGFYKDQIQKAHEKIS